MTLDSKGLDPVRSQWTDAEQQHIGQLLSRKLGQDYVSARTGAGGSKFSKSDTYVFVLILKSSQSQLHRRKQSDRISQ